MIAPGGTRTLDRRIRNPMLDSVSSEKTTAYDGSSATPSNFPSSQPQDHNLDGCSDPTPADGLSGLPDDLRMVVAQWADVPETIRQRILGLVEDATAAGAGS